MKEDRYVFDPREWSLEEGHAIVLTRKKPKVEDRENTPVKVEWRKESSFRLGTGWEYGWFAIVQFRVTGWDGKYVEKYTHYTIDNSGNIAMKLAGDHAISTFNMGISIISTHFFYIGLDAREKFSCPVLLPEKVYSRLPEICSALEQKANQGG